MQKVHGGLTTPVALSFDEAVAAARDALKREGFGVLTEIDVQETLREKLGVSVERHLILGACNPPLAHAALEADVDMGLLLPCNVTVREEHGQVIVSVIDPALLARLSESEKLAEVAGEARAKLERVIRELASV